MKRKLCALVLSLILVCMLVAPASAAAASDPREGVAVIATAYVFANGSSRLLGHGTGFFVNDEILATNHHVVADFLESGAGERLEITQNDDSVVNVYAEVRVYYDSNRYVKASVVDADEHKDLAILRLESPARERTPLVLESPTDDMIVHNEKIRAVGYPGLSDNWWMDATTSWDKNSATFTSGSMSRLLTQSGTGTRNIQVDLDIKHGNSGGPVINESNNVVGIATWGVSNNSNETVKYAINVDELILMLERNRIDYTLAGSSPNILPIALGVAAAVVIIVLLVVLLMKKGKKQPVQPVVEPVQPVSPVVRSFSQANYGTSAQVGSQPILIGRGGSCTLRFPDNTPGVSTTHCTVQWNSDTSDFVVTDLNSSYGTYTQSGQKLQPNQPYRMRAGDKFYLADPSHIIGLSLE